MIPKRVKISKEEAQKLRRLAEKQGSIQEFVRRVTEQGSEIIRQAQNESSKMWIQIAKDYNLDLDSIHWVVDPEKDEVIPVQMRLKENVSDTPIDSLN